MAAKDHAMDQITTTAQILRILREVQPTKTIELNIDQPPEALAAAVKAVAEARQRSIDSDTQHSFEGGVSDRGFSITRVARGRYAPLCKIRGKFLSTASGTRVIISFGLLPMAKLIFGAMFVLGLIGAFRALFGWLFGSISAFQFIGFAAATLLVTWIMPRLAFWYDAEGGSAFLVEVLSGRSPPSEACANYELAAGHSRSHGLAKLLYLALVALAPPCLAPSTAWAIVFQDLITYTKYLARRC